MPEGQKPFCGPINQVVECEVTETGLTAVVCQPHQTIGMVALAVVGNDFSNAEELLSARILGNGGDKIAALIEEARATVLVEAESADQNS